jgi:hypothetical protein
MLWLLVSLFKYSTSPEDFDIFFGIESELKWVFLSANLLNTPALLFAVFGRYGLKWKDGDLLMVYSYWQIAEIPIVGAILFATAILSCGFASMDSE